MPWGHVSADLRVQVEPPEGVDGGGVLREVVVQDAPQPTGEGGGGDQRLVVGVVEALRGREEREGPQPSELGEGVRGSPFLS